MMKQASWADSIGNSTVQCNLCPHFCILKEGKIGQCKVRQNVDGELVTHVYGLVSKISYEPINQNYLSGFYPNSTFLSIGTYGCNFSCYFCKGCVEVLTGKQDDYSGSAYTPEEIITLAQNHPGTIGIVFSYNEPTVWFEYMIDIARLAKQHKLKTVMISNGFINPTPLQELIQYMDAFSIDIKAFTEEYYNKVNASRLDPVKKTLKTIAESGKHLELMNTIIPELNDDINSFTQMISWIKSEIGENTILHLAGFKPGNTHDKNKENYRETPAHLLKIAQTHLKNVSLKTELS